MIETPRFKVTSVTGYGGDGGNDTKSATAYQVLDSAYCYEKVIETFARKTAERCAAAMNDGGARKTAERCAAAMNDGDFDWPRRLQAKRDRRAKRAKRFRA